MHPILRPEQSPDQRKNNTEAQPNPKVVQRERPLLMGVDGIMRRKKMCARRSRWAVSPKYAHFVSLFFFSFSLEHVEPKERVRAPKPFCIRGRAEHQHSLRLNRVIKDPEPSPGNRNVRSLEDTTFGSAAKGNITANVFFLGWLRLRIGAHRVEGMTGVSPCPTRVACSGNTRRLKAPSPAAAFSRITYLPGQDVIRPLGYSGHRFALTL